MEKNQKWPRDRPTTDSRESPPPVQQPVPQPHGSDLEALRDMILRTFPSFIYSGTVVAGGDHGPWTEALHDEDLYRTLKLQRWTDIPPGFIERHPGDFVLLTAPALAAFLPAWLIFSLDNSYQAAEFVAHTFAPQDPQDPHGRYKIRELSVELFRALNPSQRRTVRTFLDHIAEHHPSPPIADLAALAADTLDSLITVFESTSL